jgi:hypothetical protein
LAWDHSPFDKRYDQCFKIRIGNQCAIGQNELSRLAGWFLVALLMVLAVGSV